MPLVPENSPMQYIPQDRRTQIFSHYFNKYFNLFMEARHIKGLSYEQNYFVFSSLWERGRVLCTRLPADEIPSPSANSSIEGTKVYNDNTLIFTPFAPCGWNLYHQINHAHPIRLREAEFVDTNKTYNINEDAVIIWGCPSHQPINTIVYYYILEITNTQIAIDMNLHVNSQPKLVGISPEDERAVKDVERKIKKGEPVIFTTIQDSHSVVELIDGGKNYIIDKLFKHLEEVEGKLLTLLGVQNVQYEKKERITDEEASSNDSLTQIFANSITDTLQEAIDKINELFDMNLELEDRVSPQSFRETSLELQEEYGVNTQGGANNDKEEND